MPNNQRRNDLKALLVTAAVVTLCVSAAAQTFKVLHNFTSGADGGGVYGGVVMDKLGNLYGTSSGGGAYGYGAVFELSPNSDGTWTETVLHSFMLNDPEGQQPLCTLVLDAAGNLYGTAANGSPYNAGTAFELSPGSAGWTLTILYDFCAQSACLDGSAPLEGFTMDGNGNLYGAGAGGAIGNGAIVELSPGSTGWTEKVLYSFGTSNWIGGPYLGRLVFDAAGDIYGTTYLGGDLRCGTIKVGCGAVYGLRNTAVGRKESVLHRFGTIHGDGKYPVGERLALDPKGTLYGTTPYGGGTGCANGTGCGTVFEVTRTGSRRSESIIHNFGAGANGSAPVGGLVFDGVGNAYGTTDFSGTGCQCGTVFKLTPTSRGGWQYTVLHTFDGLDGELPSGPLLMDGNGNLYGATTFGGAGGEGVVFEITP
jgi:uncharacterized repeat protein (TIGR03803 family)